MLKQIRQQLIADIKETELFRLVDKYRGEFEEGSQWNPALSACFLRVMKYSPKARAADGKGLRMQAVIRVYAGANSKHNADALDLVEELIALLDGAELTGEELEDGVHHRMMVSDEGMDLILYDAGFEGYSFDLKVT